MLNRAVREMRKWIERQFELPEPGRITWIDRSPGPAVAHNRAGRADAVTGQIIRATDRVCVCDNCDATYLLETWTEVARQRSGACVLCGSRGRVRPL